MIINFFRIETEGLFRSLADYHQKLESQIPIIGKNDFEKVQEWAKQESVEYDEYDVAVDELKWNYEYYFPRSLRYSFIVLLFLIVEKQLTQLCKIIQEVHNLPIKANDLRGDFIERSKTYIHKVAGVSINNVDWTKVGDLAIVRNCIVHTMGEIVESKDKVQLQKMASANLGLSTSNDEFFDSGRLQISREYCSKVVREMQAFFDQLFDAAGIGEKWASK
jgi:hypothetical protein